MNVIQIMEQKKTEFTPNDQLIYQKISKDPGKIVQMTTSALSDACGVSQPALTRFVKGLGYTRYQDFRADLIAWLAEQRTQQMPACDHLEYFSVMNQLLREAEKILTDSYMRDLVCYINQFSRVFTTGVSKSFQPASLLETLMIKTGRFFHAVPNDNISELSDSMNENDLLIVFSVSAKHSLLKSLSGSAGKIMLVTVTSSHPYQELIDRQVLLPYIPPTPEESAVSPVLFDMFVEILCRYLTH